MRTKLSLPRLSLLRLSLPQLSLFVALLAAAPTAAQSAGQSSIQQDFETAQAALTALDVATARQGFESLLGRLKSPNSRSAGLVKSRLGAALVLDGEQEAALPLLTDALRILSADTIEDRTERAATLADRARANEALGLFQAAAADWRAALALAGAAPGTGADLQLRAGLGRALIWADPAAARRDIDALLAALPQTPETREQRALVTLLRGRVELNDGNPRGALDQFNAAARLAGGASTTRINRADVQIRGDLALAYHLLGSVQEQQRLVAYSGAGTLVAEGLGSAASTPLPACGAETGLAPGDVAVVEFAISDDGRVRAAVPIYAARADGRRETADGGPATLFVQAVRGWFWRPGSVAKLEPFWRQAVRVELRCSAARPAVDLVASSFADQRAAGISALGVRAVPPVAGSDAAALPALKAELQRRIAADGPQSVQLVLPLLWLASNSAADRSERIAWKTQQIALMEAAGAPGDMLAFERARLVELQAMGGRRQATTIRDGLAPLLDAEAAARPTARTTNYLRLQLAEAQDRLRARQQAEALLQAIVATPIDALGRADPIRTAALLRLSNIAAARNDKAGASQALAATGLSPEQCALVDVRPLPENKRVSATVFPDQARRWKTGGLTRVEYDIEADGRPSNVRTVLSSPPFVFGEATERGARQFRFEPVFRPGNAPGCLGAQDNFRFVSG